MLVNPQKGQPVELRYREKLRALFEHHGKRGVVEIAGRGKPRNHLIRLESGERIVVPCGHLYAV